MYLQCILYTNKNHVIRIQNATSGQPGCLYLFSIFFLFFFFWLDFLPGSRDEWQLGDHRSELHVDGEHNGFFYNNTGTEKVKQSCIPTLTRRRRKKRPSRRRARYKKRFSFISCPHSRRIRRTLHFCRTYVLRFKRPIRFVRCYIVICIWVGARTTNIVRNRFTDRCAGGLYNIIICCECQIFCYPCKNKKKRR